MKLNKNKILQEVITTEKNVYEPETFSIVPKKRSDSIEVPLKQIIGLPEKRILNAIEKVEDWIALQPWWLKTFFRMFRRSIERILIILLSEIKTRD